MSKKLLNLTCFYNRTQVKAYLDELHSSEIARNFKEQIEDVPIITLLYAAKDEEHNHALVLKEFLKSLG